MLDRARIFISREVTAFLGVFNKCNYAVGKKSDMREVPKLQLRKKSNPLACHFERTHPLSSYQVDTHAHIADMRKDAFFELLGQRQIGGFVVTGTPSMLLAIGANIDDNFIFGLTHLLLLLNMLKHRYLSSRKSNQLIEISQLLNFDYFHAL